MILYHVPRNEFDRARSFAADDVMLTSLFADLCRVNILYMITRAGSGHIGTSFSSVDILSWIILRELGWPAESGEAPLYFSSKGHDAPALYAVMTAVGLLDFDLIHTLRRLGGLPGHPDVGTPGIPTNTGSLGMGISKAKGFVEAARLDGKRQPVFVLTGDGELQEGQIWESLAGAANRRLGELTVIVDHNKIQSDTWVSDVSDLGDLEAKFLGFGWAIRRCDGHDLGALSAALQELAADPEVPGVLVADTVKGKGVPFMEGVDDEGRYRFHSGAPDYSTYRRALDELVASINATLASLGADVLGLKEVEVADPMPASGQRLVDAYGAALVCLADRDPSIVVLDADLVLDCGLIPFSRRFPDRFIECGIAEQDMVSQAGALALRQRLPIAHSFASFLVPRAAEQMYNNATEGTKVVYVGSLAGLVPGGPGHSHQAVRDIALVASLPGLTAVEPSHAEEVEPLLDLCLHDLPGSVYVRLVTVPIDVPFRPPAGYRPIPGVGMTLRHGSDGVVFGYGPVLLTQAMLAAELLSKGYGVDLRMVGLPWLNRVDDAWLAGVTTGQPLVVTLDNHCRSGGQGEMILAALARLGRSVPCLQRTIDEVPVCGTNEEVLRHHRLDAQSLAEDILAATSTQA